VNLKVVVDGVITLLVVSSNVRHCGELHYGLLVTLQCNKQSKYTINIFNLFFAI